MKTRRLISIFLAIAIAISIFLIKPVNVVLAGGDGSGNVFYLSKMTKADQQQLATKNKQALDHAKSKTAGVSPNSIVTKTIWVGGMEVYREPNLIKYRNYCVPSSTQVAIRARTASVPSLDTVAAGEYTHDDGTDINNAKPYINSYLHTSWYVVGKASSSTILGNWIKMDIDSTWSLMTLLDTRGMPGWSIDAWHYVATNGYTATVGTTTVVTNVNFVDTSSEIAGHHYGSGGSYFESASMSTFWTWVTNHPYYGQVW
jgi:hypothetical protein